MNKDNVTIRPLADADLARCAEIMGAQDPWKALGIGAERCLASISGAHLRRYGLYLEDQVAGLAVVHPTGFASSPYLAVLAVEAAHTGRGLGSRLLTHVEEEVFRDWRNLFLCVTSFNERAQRFYLARGYVHIGTIKDYFKPGCDELIMRKVRGETPPPGPSPTRGGEKGFGLTLWGEKSVTPPSRFGKGAGGLGH